MQKYSIPDSACTNLKSIVNNNSNQTIYNPSPTQETDDQIKRLVSSYSSNSCSDNTPNIENPNITPQ